MEKLFKVEYPDGLGEGWLGVEEMESCLFSPTNISEYSGGVKVTSVELEVETHHEPGPLNLSGGGDPDQVPEGGEEEEKCDDLICTECYPPPPSGKVGGAAGKQWRVGREESTVYLAKPPRLRVEFMFRPKDPVRNKHFQRTGYVVGCHFDRNDVINYLVDYGGDMDKWEQEGDLVLARDM